MRSGVRIKEIVEGNGHEAVRGKTVAANVRWFLNQGTELPTTVPGGPGMVIDLGKREIIAGLRYGSEGMRVGGKREIKVSPHLAYGAEGIPGHVPPNAVIRCEIELLDVRDAGVRKEEDFPPGKFLYVFHPGETARNRPRWQFGLTEDGRCGITITRPIPGMAWRHARHSIKETHLDPVTTRTLFEEAFALRNNFPEDCLRPDELFADMTVQGNAITRQKVNNVLCLTIGVQERRKWLEYFSLVETSKAMQESPLMAEIDALLREESGTDPS